MKLLYAALLSWLFVFHAEAVDPAAYDGQTALALAGELEWRFNFCTEKPDGLTFFDTRYVSPPKEILERCVAKAFKKVDKDYTAELHDCDDIAWEMLVFLRREVRAVTGPRLEWGLAAGLISLQVNQPLPELGMDFGKYPCDHAAVLVRVKGGVWWIIEPSTGKGTKLDEELFDGRVIMKGVWF